MALRVPLSMPWLHGLGANMREGLLEHVFVLMSVTAVTPLESIIALIAPSTDAAREGQGTHRWDARKQRPWTRVTLARCHHRFGAPCS